MTRELLDEQEPAQQAIERVTKLRREAVGFDDTNLASKLRLLVAAARAGQFAEGLQLAKQLEATLDKDATTRYDLACGYAQLAKAREGLTATDDAEADSLPSAEELQAAAIAAIKEAMDAGFFRITDLKLDPDLSPIRELPAFQALIKDRV